MELGVRSSQKNFSFECLPNLVFDHIVHYLDRRDRENMAQVNRYLRNVFNSPRLWKGIEIRLRKRKHDRNFDPHVLEMLKVRGITNLICTCKFELQIATLQPHLERLSLLNTGRSTLRALCKAASNGYLNHLKRLDLGSIYLEPVFEPLWPEKFLDLFKCLPILEKVSLGSPSDVLYFHAGLQSWFNGNDVFLTAKVPTTNPLAHDLKQALCYSGKLTSLSLICFKRVGESWLNTVMVNNPHLQSLSLSFIDTFGEGPDDAVDLPTCSNLRTFRLTQIPLNGRGTANKILSWAFPGDKPYENVTSLDLSSCRDPTIYSVLVKFPALKKLKLSVLCSPHLENNFSLPNFQNLEWFEVRCHYNLTENGLLQLSKNAGKNLHSLDLTYTQLKEDCLRNLPAMFPALKTLDLSGCSKLTDATLVEWYIKRDKSEWPKLRKLVVKYCHAITQDVVDSVRLKTKNQLLINYRQAPCFVDDC